MIKKLFLEEFPEYQESLEITVNHSKRFSENGGDLIVKTKHHKYPEYNTYIYFWFEKDDSGNITFEKQREYNVLRVDITLGGVITERIYLKQSDVLNMDYSEKEDLALKKFIKEKEKEIRQELAEKILSGEMDLNFFVGDSDSYECPPSKIQNRIISL